MEEFGSVEANLDISFSENEVEKALTSMPNGKATGENGIPIECLKVVKREGIVILAAVLNRLWVDGKLPEGWEKARVRPLYKDGDVNSVDNYRGIIF